MPDIAQGNQVFDLEFHPSSDHVYTALLTGEIRSHSYTSEAGTCILDWSVRPTKRSCRSLALDATGDRLYSVSKDKSLQSVRKNFSQKCFGLGAYLAQLILVLERF